MGSSQCAQISQASDSDVDAQHVQTVNSESQNPRGDLQPSFGTAAVNGRVEGGILLSFSQPARGKPDSLADPFSAFQAVDSLGLIQSQPIDLGA